jgi:hypothetical protein
MHTISETPSSTSHRFTVFSKSQIDLQCRYQFEIDGPTQPLSRRQVCYSTAVYAPSCQQGLNHFSLLSQVSLTPKDVQNRQQRQRQNREAARRMRRKRQEQLDSLMKVSYTLRNNCFHDPVLRLPQDHGQDCLSRAHLSLVTVSSI